MGFFRDEMHRFCATRVDRREVSVADFGDAHIDFTSLKQQHGSVQYVPAFVLFVQR